MSKPQSTKPLHVLFENTPEIFATDSQGGFNFQLRHDGSSELETAAYDEVRFVASLWHPAEGQKIDLDRAYVELRAQVHVDDDHWTKLAEIEPVVSPYNSGERFDGWIVLPVLTATTSFRICGGGFSGRSRLQIRTSAYFVP